MPYVKKAELVALERRKDDAERKLRDIERSRGMYWQTSEVRTPDGNWRVRFTNATPPPHPDIIVQPTEAGLFVFRKVS